MELLCQEVRAWQWTSPEMMVRRFTGAVSGGKTGREDKEEVGNVASKHQRVSSECGTEYGNCADTKCDR